MISNHGDLDNAKVVDGVAPFWFALAISLGYGRSIAFKMLEEG